jgi:single-stranded DNA-binding protein
MATINDVTLIGIVKNEPEFKFITTDKGTFPFWHAVLKVKRLNSGNTNDIDKRMDFPHVIAWNEQAEDCNLAAHEGTKLLIKGRLQSRNFEKTNEASPEQYNEMLKFIRELGVPQESEQEVLNKILEISHLDGRETKHTAYEVSISQVEFLSNFEPLPSKYNNFDDEKE